MKQTAVDWFQDQIIKIVNGTCELSEIQIYEQAKEMEKQQMIEMHDKGFDSVEQLNDEFAIEFAEWLLKNYDGIKSVKELLQIYKKEKGL